MLDNILHLVLDIMETPKVISILVSRERANKEPL